MKTDVRMKTEPEFTSTIQDLKFLDKPWNDRAFRLAKQRFKDCRRHLRLNRGADQRGIETVHFSCDGNLQAAAGTDRHSRARCSDHHFRVVDIGSDALEH